MSNQAFDDWVASIAAGEATMSQRNLKWVETNGGLEDLIDAAKRRNVHLVLLTDDKGNQLVAASSEAFTTLC